MKKFVLAILLLASLFFNAQKRGELISQELVLDLSKESIQSWIHKNINQDLSLDPFILNFLLFNKKDLKAYKLTYWTEDYDKTLLKATGLVMIPNTNQYKTIVTYGHPTTDKKENVPSNLKDALVINFVLPLSYALNDFVVIAPDYIGMGDGEGIHRYLHAETEANAMIDMRRASDALFKELHTKLNGQNFLAGYSQGAHAGMATLKALKEDYNQEYSFDYAYLLSGPYDMSDSNWNHYLSDQEIVPFPPVQLATLYTCDAIGYPLYTNSSEMLKPQYNEIYNKEIVGFANGLTFPGLNNKWKEMFNENWLDPHLNISTRPNTPLFKCLEENNVYDWNNTTETTLAYSVIDQVVPYKNTIKTVKTQQDYYPWFDFWNRFKIKAIPLFGGHVVSTTPYLIASNADFSLRRFIYNIFNAPNYSRSNKIITPSNEGQIIDIIDFNQKDIQKVSSYRSSKGSFSTEHLTPGIYMLKKQYDDGSIAYEPFAKKERIFLENVNQIIKKTDHELFIDIKGLNQTISHISVNDQSIPFSIKNNSIHIENKDLQLNNIIVIHTKELDEYAFEVKGIEKNINSKENIQLYSSHNTVFVQSKEKLHSIEIYNLLGQPIFSNQNINQTEFQVNLKNTNGILIIKITDTKGQTVQKRITT
ncbi:hypothetical protein UJ101_02567 [Flavobacteriaceae bacterium UJ101]|nr:hypothetical protein UJ101_02567 [Flavobacteriaceae bacterium UJ101]